MRPTNVRASVGSSRSGSSASATVIVPPAFAVAWFVLLPVLLLPHPAATSAATTPATAKLNVRRMLTLLPERDGPPTRVTTRSQPGFHVPGATSDRAGGGAPRTWRHLGNVPEVHSGRHFLQIPGPTNVPERVLRAMSAPTIDHRGPEFAAIAADVLERLPDVFQTSGPVVVYPSSGTGAWEAALVNTLSPGDRVLAFETGHFATLWRALAERLGLEVDFVPGDWRHGVDPDAVAARLGADRDGAIRAGWVAHNEPSTGVASRIAEVRAARDAVGHEALLIVDTISSLGSIDYRHDEWGVDVTVGCSQKGLMLPPGLGFNAVSERALEASRTARLPRSYWDWGPIVEANAGGGYPYTPPTNLLYGLRESLAMLFDEGLPKVFARHRRFGEAARRAVRAWGLELVCCDPQEFSDSLTAVMMPA